MIHFRCCKGTTMPLIIAVLDTVMTTRLWASAKLTVALILILAARPSTGQDTVKALSTTNGGQGPIRQCVEGATNFNGQSFNEVGCLHDVYTVSAINQKVGALSNQLTSVDSKLSAAVASIAKTGGPIDQAVIAEDTKIKAEVKEAIDNLPQRLLSQAAKDAIKTAILADVQDQIQQLRSDLQQQIDQLKKPAPQPSTAKMNTKPIGCDLSLGTSGGH